MLPGGRNREKSGIVKFQLPMQKLQRKPLGWGVAFFSAIFLPFFMCAHYYFCSDGKEGTTSTDIGRKRVLLSPSRRVREERESVWLQEPSIAAFNEVTRHVMRIQFPFSCENSCYYSLSYNHPHGFGSREI